MTQITELTGRNVLISGGSRGIGLAVARRLARGGARICFLAKTGQPHPRLEGTVHTAVEQVQADGGAGQAVVGDLRHDDDIAEAVKACVQQFGGIDVVINNASAIDLRSTEKLPMKSYDLMHDINVRGSFALSQAAFPYLRESAAQGRKPHVLTFSPPIATAHGLLDPGWFAAHMGYTMSKYAMSMVTIGLAAEWNAAGITASSLWPETLIETAAIAAMPDSAELLRGARSPEIMADAAWAVLSGEAGIRNGELLTDEEVLARAGVEDFSSYALNPGEPLSRDIFLGESPQNFADPAQD